MNYKNGEVASVGDMIIGTTWQGQEVSGRVAKVVEGCGRIELENGTVLLVGNCVRMIALVEPEAAIPTPHAAPVLAPAAPAEVPAPPSPTHLDNMQEPPPAPRPAPGFAYGELPAHQHDEPTE